MTDKEKQIAQLCIHGVERISVMYGDGEAEASFIESLDILEKIHRLVNPDYDRICKAIEETEDK